MDEILIEDKKYVSSKRAAKITGYAKDYIGQLCREGRVPARLIGRSWYVLESALQDHRFGNDGSQTKPPEEKAEEMGGKEGASSNVRVVSSRYEVEKSELLPVVDRITPKAEATISNEVGNEPDNLHEELQKSWQDWFSHINSAKEEPQPPVIKEEDPAPAEPEPHEEVAVEPQQDEETAAEEPEDSDVSIPIHTVYELPPEELLPHAVSDISEEEEAPAIYKQSKFATGGKTIVALQVFGMVLALVMATLAIVSTGVTDKYIISFSPAHLIAGLGVVNK